MIYHQTSSEDIVKTYLDYITLLWRPQPNLFTWHSTPQWMNDAPPHQIWLQRVAQCISSGQSQTHGLTDRMIPHPTTPKNNINKRHFITLEGIVVTKFVFRSHKSSNQHRSIEAQNLRLHQNNFKGQVLTGKSEILIWDLSMFSAYLTHLSPTVGSPSTN